MEEAGIEKVRRLRREFVEFVDESKPEDLKKSSALREYWLTSLRLWLAKRPEVHTSRIKLRSPVWYEWGWQSKFHWWLCNRTFPFIGADMRIIHEGTGKELPRWAIENPKAMARLDVNVWIVPDVGWVDIELKVINDQTDNAKKD